MRQARICAFHLTAVLAFAGAAQAQEFGIWDTTSHSTSLVFNPVTINTVNLNTFTTQIIGQIVGGSVVYDQTFGLPYADPAVQAGQTAAIAAITTAGGPGVVIAAPVKTASTTTTNSTTSPTVFSLVSSVDTVNPVVTTFGPANVATGELTSCTGLGTLPSTTAPTCSAAPGTILSLGVEEIDHNTHTDTVATIDQTATTTNVTNLFEQYTVSGTVVPVGGEHASAISTIGFWNERFTQVLLGNIVAGASSSSNVMALAIPGETQTAMGWAEGFGWKGHGVNDKRSGAGMEGGLTVNASDNVKLGFGVSHGSINVSLDDGTGSADGQLTEVGAAASWANNGLYLGGVGVAGFGSVKTHGLVSNAKYDATLFSVAGEAGDNFSAGDLTLTPNAGGQWLFVNTGDFTSTGSPALTSSGSHNNFGKGWIGLKARSEMEQLTLSAYGRLVVYSDENIRLPVSFVGSTTTATISGAERKRFGVEAGLAANYALSDSLTAFASYDVRLRDSTAIHEGILGISANW